MDDILLLPEDLQRKSLSRREIVLMYNDALQALDILENASWTVLGWEPWLKFPNGSHVHPVMGGDFPRSAMEDWITCVHRAAQLCRDVMKEEQQRWDQGNFFPQDDPDWKRVPSMLLYFCLTASKDE